MPASTVLARTAARTGSTSGLSRDGARSKPASTAASNGLSRAGGRSK
jgi:hypothetical protein